MAEVVGLYAEFKIVFQPTLRLLQMIELTVGCGWWMGYAGIKNQMVDLVNMESG